MNWNPVLNKYLEIKSQAIQAGIALWDYDQAVETCLDYWVRMLGIKEYIDLVEYLQLVESQDCLLIRYANYANILGGGKDVTFDSFWEMYDGFYLECRSVVIDIKKDCLVLTPFRKFKNINESDEYSEESIKKRIKNASCVEVSNKLDGSMQSARFYDGEIVMAGSQSLSRENSWRLADGYRMLMEDEAYGKMLRENSDQTFIFEYISQQDAHVVIYEEEGLYLIGIRDVNTGKEASYKEVLDYAKRYGIKTTEVFDKTLDEIMHSLDDKKSSEAEGFVVNIDGFKVKIKYNDYTSMHRILSDISSINVIIKAVAENQFDDLKSKVPASYRDRVLKVATLVWDYQRKMMERSQEYYKQAPKEDRKEFMIWVEKNVESEYKGYVRNLYLGNKNNYLKGSNGRYKKLKEMGVSDYKSVMK